MEGIESFKLRRLRRSAAGMGFDRGEICCLIRVMNPMLRGMVIMEEGGMQL